MQYIDNGLVLKDNVKYVGINLHLLFTSWECILLHHKRCDIFILMIHQSLPIRIMKEKICIVEWPCLIFAQGQITD